VWQDADSLRMFVRRTPHDHIMTDLLSNRDQTEFFHWDVDGFSVPPDWEEAKRRMRER
jgi:hypothetical protein